MGWLFAVALGMHRGSGRVVVMSLVPIALGHAVAVAAVVALVMLVGIVLDLDVIRYATGGLLVVWAVYHAVYGHRHRVRVGLQTGMAGLGVWSFLMATAHGAGLMLVPILIPLCLAATPARDITAGSSWPIALAAVAIHTLAMLAVTGIIAVVVYKWFGLGFLRRGWINLDYLWTAALIGAGVFVMVW